MRVVAVAADHEAFIDPMLAGQVELCPHVRVAAVASLWLTLGQQELGTGGMMVGMAFGAGDIVLGVLRAADVGAIEVLGMAFEALSHDFRRLHRGKRMRNRVPAAAGCDMGFGGAMASLAACIVW